MVYLEDQFPGGMAVPLSIVHRSMLDGGEHI